MPADDFLEGLHLTRQVRDFLEAAQVHSVAATYSALADSLLEIGVRRLSEQERRERESALVALSRADADDTLDRVRKPPIQFGGAVPLPEATGPAAAIALAAAPAPFVTLSSATAAAANTVASPKGFTLSGDFFAAWPAKEQGDRQTCVAFAVTACIELANSGGDAARLEAVSRQHLYYYMRKVGEGEARRPRGWSKGATLLRYAKKALKTFGYCPDADALYYGSVMRIEGPKPDADARATALAAPGLAFEYQDYPPPKRPTLSVADEIIAELSARRPVAVAVATFGPAPNAEAAWVHARSDGVVRMPSGSPPIDAANSGHVVAVFRFVPDATDRSGGWFIFKNSWGDDFAEYYAGTPLAAQLLPGRGFGALSREYVDKYCWEWLSVHPDPNAPARTGALSALPNSDQTS